MTILKKDVILLPNDIVTWEISGFSLNRTNLENIRRKQVSLCGPLKLYLVTGISIEFIHYIKLFKTV